MKPSPAEHSGRRRGAAPLLCDCFKSSLPFFATQAPCCGVKSQVEKGKERAASSLRFGPMAPNSLLSVSTEVEHQVLLRLRFGNVVESAQGRSHLQ